MKKAAMVQGFLAARTSHLVKKQLYTVIILLLLACSILTLSSFRNKSSLNSFQKGINLKKDVPFKGKFDVELKNGIVGTGEGTHIGRFTLVAQDDETAFPFITGTVTITAANGDEIFATHTGLAQEFGNGMLQVDFNNIITGGTGRFSGAIGDFTIHVLINETIGIGDATFNGRISY